MVLPNKFDKMSSVYLDNVILVLAVDTVEIAIRNSFEGGIATSHVREVLALFTEKQSFFILFASTNLASAVFAQPGKIAMSNMHTFL